MKKITVHKVLQTSGKLVVVIGLMCILPFSNAESSLSASEALNVEQPTLRYKTKPMPIYPTQSKELGEEGTVRLKIIGGKDGTVKQAVIVKSSGYLRLDDAALAAVKKSSFHPYLVNGKAAEFSLQLPVAFRLPSKNRLSFKNRPTFSFSEEYINEGEIRTIALLVTINIDGTVNSVDILQPSGTKSLDKKAAEEMKKSIFYPVLKNGEPVEYTERVTLVFRGKS